MCNMTRSHVWHDSFTCVTWLVHVCDVTRSHVWHDSFTSVPWLVHVCDMTCSRVWHDSFTCVTWLVHMCDMTRSHVWCDSCIQMAKHAYLVCICDNSCVCTTCDLMCIYDMTYMWKSRVTHIEGPWVLSYMWKSRVAHIVRQLMSLVMCIYDMTHEFSHMYILTWLMCLVMCIYDMALLYGWHDSFTCITWLIHICDKTHAREWHGSFKPPKKLLKNGFLTPYTSFYLICTISSELTYISHLYHLEWAGVESRQFSVDGFDTRWIPRKVLCGVWHDSFPY